MATKKQLEALKKARAAKAKKAPATKVKKAVKSAKTKKALSGPKRRSRMSVLKTNLGKTIKVTSNKSARTFTIVTETAKYRTYPMSKEEFRSCEHNTGNDWQYFLKSNDYYVVKK